MVVEPDSPWGGPLGRFELVARPFAPGGPPRRALVAATTLGAAVTAGLAFAFAAFASAPATSTRPAPLSRMATVRAVSPRSHDEGAALELLHSAQVAIEAYAADHRGSYAGATAPILARYEPLIAIAKDHGDAWLSSVSASGAGYALTVTTPNGARFRVASSGATVTATASGVVTAAR
jgi:hypothetical protein